MSTGALGILLALMAVHPTADRDAAADEGDGSKRDRKLHSLTGILLGAFLVLHLATQATALGGAGAYDRIAGPLSRSSVIALFELLVVLALALHVVSGIRRLARRRVPDSELARYGGRRLWAMQRISAVVVLAFVLVHVYELRVARLAFGLSADALHSTLEGRLSSTWGGVPWTALFYLAGLGATAFHVANGLFVALGDRLVTRARRRFVTVALGAILFGTGGATVVSLATGRAWGSSQEHEELPCGAAVSTEREAMPSSR